VSFASLMTALLDRFESTADAFRPLQLGQTLWSIASLELGISPALLRAVLESAERSVHTWSPEHCANFLWSLGKSRPLMCPS
jgi:hypothetical protein